MNATFNQPTRGRMFIPPLAHGAIVLVLLALALPGCVFVSGDLNPFSRRERPLKERVVRGEAGAKILLLDIARVITMQPERGVFGLQRRESVAGRVEEELRRAAKDDQVKALIVRINSPGGTVTASDVVYRELMRFKAKRHVPVVAQLMDVAASGGYYVALAADEIVAYPTTVTGSIGVIFRGVNVAGLLAKIGVRDQTIKSGAKKDIGSPLRAMTPEERQLLGEILGGMRDRFVALVRKRRPKLTADGVKLIADGRILSAEQALAIGLVDRVGGMEDSIALARERAGLKTAKVVVYRRSDEAGTGVYARSALGSPAGGPLVNLLQFNLGALLPDPQFLYLWAPGAE